MVKEIYTPSGNPPFAPKEATSQALLEWADRIQAQAPPNTIYTTDALIYWCRYFWDTQSEEYKMAKKILNDQRSQAQTEEL